MSGPIPDSISESERFASLAELQQEHDRLSEQRPQGAPTPEFLEAVLRFILRGERTGVVLDDPAWRRSAQTILDYWSAVLGRFQKAAPDATLASYDASQCPQLPARCPYRGLDYFREEDRAVFFGRAGFVAELAELLKEQRLVAVVGRSGCGKSSVVRAGLLPTLRQSPGPDGNPWRILPSIFPGTDPMAALQGAGVLELLAPPVPGRAAAPEPTLLVVDQFEELFTLSPPPERDRFIAALVSLVTSKEAPHRLVLTLRTDFEDFLIPYKEFFALYSAGKAKVPPLVASELREAIERPAASTGLRIKPGVVNSLVQDLLGEEAGLPLLQFTLWRLWEVCREQRQSTVTAEMYEQVGGGRNALTRYAEEVYSAVKLPEDQLALERLLLRLALPVALERESTRARVLRRNLGISGVATAVLDRAIKRLTAARLIRLSPAQSGDEPTDAPIAPDAQLELAHEALVRNWKRLADWLAEDEQTHKQVGRLTERALSWHRLGSSNRGLLDPAEISEAERLIASSNAARIGIGEDIHRYLAASKRAQLRTQRRLIISLSVFVVLFCIAVGASAVAYRRQVAQQRVAHDLLLKQDEIKALHADTRKKLEASYKEHARKEISRGEPGRAAVYLNEIYADSRADPTVALYVAQATATQRIAKELSRHFDGVTSVLWSADGQQILTSSRDHTAKIWDVATEKVLHTLSGHSEILYSAIYGSRDVIFTASRDGTVRAWSADGKQIGQLYADKIGKLHEVTAAACHSSLRCVTSHDDHIALWSFNPKERPLAGELLDYRQSGDKLVRSIAFSPDGASVAVGNDDQLAEIWTIEGDRLKKRGQIPHLAAVRAVAFRPRPCGEGTEPQLLATASEDGAVRIFNLARPGPDKQVHELRGDSALMALAFSADGCRIAAAGTSRSTRIWDVETGALLVTVQGPQGRVGWVRSVAFSPDGKMLATAGYDGTVQIRELSDLNLTRVFGGEKQPAELASADEKGERFVTLGNNRLVIAREVVSGNELCRLAPLAEKPESLFIAMSPDGRSFVTTGSGRLGAQLYTIPKASEQVQPCQPGPAFETGSVVRGASFSSDGTGLVTALVDGRALVFDTTSGQEITELSDPQGKISAAIFSPRTPGYRTVMPPRQPAPAQRRKPTAPEAPVSPLIAAAVSAGESTSLRLFALSGDAKEQRPSKAAPQLPQIQSLAFSHDGSLLAVGSGDGTIKVFEVARFLEERSPDKGVLPWRTLFGHRGKVLTLAFSTDDKWLATGASDQTVRLWDVGAAVELIPPSLHGQAVTSVALLRGNEIILSAAEDHTARLWTLRLQTPMSPIEFEQWVCLNIPLVLDPSVGTLLPPTGPRNCSYQSPQPELRRSP